MEDYFSFPASGHASLSSPFPGPYPGMDTALLFLPLGEMESGVGTHTQILEARSQAILLVTSGGLHTP